MAIDRDLVKLTESSGARHQSTSDSPPWLLLTGFDVNRVPAEHLFDQYNMLSVCCCDAARPPRPFSSLHFGFPSTCITVSDGCDWECELFVLLHCNYCREIKRYVRYKRYNLAWQHPEEKTYWRAQILLVSSDNSREFLRLKKKIHYYKVLAIANRRTGNVVILICWG